MYIMLLGKRRGGVVAGRHRTELTAAAATPLVLAILSEGESYGYAILKRVRELSGGEREWSDAVVYPLFHRLRRLGYLTAEWRTVGEGRRRRYYAITDDGRAALGKRQRRWANAMRRHARGVTDGVESLISEWHAPASLAGPAVVHPGWVW